MVVRTPTDDNDDSSEFNRRAMDVHMYVTTNLKSLVWKSAHTSSTYSMPMSDVTGIVCLNVMHVLPKTWQKYAFVEKEHPVLRIMISQSTVHWDCILSNQEEFQDWLSGLSLAYGMQTVSVSPKREEEEDDEDGMETM